MADRELAAPRRAGSGAIAPPGCGRSGPGQARRRARRSRRCNACRVRGTRGNADSRRHPAVHRPPGRCLPHELRRPACRRLQRHAQALTRAEPDRGLLAISRGILERLGVQVDVVRIVDHVIPPGVWPDMTTQGYERDDFPRIYRELVEPADIILIAGPIWLGDQSSPDAHRHRAPVRVLRRGQRRRPVVLLRQGRRRRDDRQRGRRQACQRPGPLCPPAHRPHDPAPVRRLLERRGRPRRLLLRPRQRRPGERLDHPQHRRS